MNLERGISKFVAVLAHPIFTGIYGLFLLYSMGLAELFPGEYLRWMSPHMRKWVLIIVAVNTVLVPLSLFPFYLSRGIIGSIRMETARERYIPLLLQMVMYLITYYLLSKIEAPALIRLFILCGAVISTLAAIISRYWKISLHSMAMGALTAMVLSVSLRFNAEGTALLLLMIFFSGITASSRLRLDEHQPLQVYVGYLMGFMATIFVIFFA